MTTVETGVRCEHIASAVCWLCSDQVSWWREARERAGLPHPQSFVEWEEPVVKRKRSHHAAKPTNKVQLSTEEASLIRMLRAEAHKRGISMATLSNATRREVEAQIAKASA